MPAKMDKIGTPRIRTLSIDSGCDAGQSSSSTSSSPLADMMAASLRTWADRIENILRGELQRANEVTDNARQLLQTVGEHRQRAVVTCWLHQLSDVLTCSTQLVTAVNNHTKEAIWENVQLSSFAPDVSPLPSGDGLDCPEATMDPCFPVGLVDRLYPGSRQPYRSSTPVSSRLERHKHLAAKQRRHRLLRKILWLRDGSRKKRARNRERERNRCLALRRYLECAETPLVTNLGLKMAAARSAAAKKRRTAMLELQQRHQAPDLRELFYDSDGIDPRFNGFQFWKEMLKDVSDEDVAGLLARSSSSDRLGMVARMALLESRQPPKDLPGLRPAYRYRAPDEDETRSVASTEATSVDDDVTSASFASENSMAVAVSEDDKNKEEEQKQRQLAFAEAKDFREAMGRDILNSLLEEDEERWRRFAAMEPHLDETGSSSVADSSIGSTTASTSVCSSYRFLPLDLKEEEHCVKEEEEELKKEQQENDEQKNFEIPRDDNIHAQARRL